MTEGSNLFIKSKTSSNTAYTLRGYRPSPFRKLLPSVVTLYMLETIIHLERLDEKITLEDDLAYKMTDYLLQKKVLLLECPVVLQLQILF